MRLIFAELLGLCLPPRLFLVIDVRERLPVAVLDDEASEVIFNCPRWREAARGGGHELMTTKGPIKIHHPADNGCADECPDKYA
jgi:hypothetical protein